MKKIKFLLLLIIPVMFLSTFMPKVQTKNTFAQSERVFLGGYPVGITINSRGAEVVGVCDVVCGEKIYSPSKDADIKTGDVILKINQTEVNNAIDIANAIKDGQTKIIELVREDNILITNIKPQKDNSGEYKLGLFIKNGINGIGTVTYFTTEKIACLGHPVLGQKNEIVDCSDGEIFSCDITSVVKGVRGRPGELRGSFNQKKHIGEVKSNKINGIYGNLTDLTILPLLEVETSTPQMGNASIYTTTNGNTPEKYDISIIKYDKDIEDKNLVIKITDKRLLEISNGIVQGMSGSPIVQNGKLVGAVTHVFINDPTRGFGISIENMM